MQILFYISQIFVQQNDHPDDGTRKQVVGERSGPVSQAMEEGHAVFGPCQALSFTHGSGAFPRFLFFKKRAAY